MKKCRKLKINLTLPRIITLFVLFYWVWLFYMTQPATASNTYQQQADIINVKIQITSHRGNDKLYIISNDNCFMLDTGWQNKKKSYDLAECILSDNEKLTVTVWKHIPRNLFDVYNSNFKVHQVTDLRSASNVYWDITNHNNYQQNERIVGIIAGIFISSIDVLFNLVGYWGTRGRFCVNPNKK